MEALILRWIGIGYEPTPVVIEPGTFSRRGGILDIFTLASEYPLRIEFFDDEIESLRLFDPGDQRSVKRVDSARIVAAREALPKLTPAVGANLAKLSQANSEGEAGATSLSADIESLRQGSAFAHLEHYLPLLYDERASLLNYAPDNALVLAEEPDFLEMTAQEIVESAEENRADVLSSSQITPEHPVPYLPWRALQSDIERLTCVSLANQPVSEAPRDFAPGERFGGQLRPMLNRVRQLA